MTLEQRLGALATALGTDVKGLRNMIGVLANLTTDAKGNLVVAVNEVDASADLAHTKIGGTTTSIAAAVGSAGTQTVTQALAKLYVDIGTVEANVANLINDSAMSGDLTHTYSADKIIQLVNGLETKILGGMPPEMFDTIKELADYLSDNTVAGGLIQQLGKKVDVSMVQTFTALEQEQGRANINAASNTEFQALVIGIGDYDANLEAIYEAAKV